MKITFLVLAILVGIAFSGNSTGPVAGVAKSGDKERGVARFDKPVMLMGVELKGEYLFIHENAAMARGEACTYVYKGTGEVRSKLVLSFHCKPELRNKAHRFTIRSMQTPTGVYEVKEVQFEGSDEGHLVPAN